MPIGIFHKSREEFISLKKAPTYVSAFLVVTNGLDANIIFLILFF